MTANDSATMFPCPLCASEASLSLTKDGCPYFACSQCEFLFYRGAPGGQAAHGSAFYDANYWEMERREAERREKDDGFLRALELLYLSSIRVENILDFGCGLGITVRLLRESLGLNAVGVDIAADFTETGFLHRCGLAELSAKYPPAFFDAVYSVEVFEHLENPGEILQLLNPLLKPEAKILINTGTREYLARYDRDLKYIDPLRRGHISIYSLKSLQGLAATIGRKAEFLGVRGYEVILMPEGGKDGPHPANLERTRLFGEWFPSMFAEYMRLIYVEREFEARSLWAVQLSQMVEKLSPKTRRALAAKPFLKKLWARTLRRSGP